MSDVPATVSGALLTHEPVDEVRLIGSRLNGVPSSLSDWDFEIGTRQPAAVARDIPALTATLEPIIAQWERLAYRANYMLLLPGPVKIDVMLDLDRPKEPTWIVSKETLQGIDDHFWDWIFWLASKDEKKQGDRVRQQFELMHRHLLQPMIIRQSPSGIADAVSAYLAARERLCRRLDVVLSRDAEQEVVGALREAGYAV